MLCLTVAPEKIEGLEDYKGVPCPTLMVFLDGQMKTKITGANAPKLIKTVNEVRSAPVRGAAFLL